MEEEIELVFNTNFWSVFLILLSFPQIKLLHWNLSIGTASSTLEGHLEKSTTLYGDSWSKLEPHKRRR